MTDPGAFLSYVRADDAHDDGFVTELASRLADEVRVQTGHPFEIFTDRNSIDWGQQWQRRLSGAIDATSILLPIVTPSFFESPACRQELEQFREREVSSQNDELILPIYYVSSPKIDDERVRETDDLAQLLASRQYTDWREYRFEALTSATVRKAIAQMARQIAHVIRRSAGAEPRPEVPVDSSRKPSAEDEVTEGPSTSQDLSSSSKTEVRTITVDPWGRGDYESIAPAIIAAAPGSRLLVRPGLYRESIVIDKVLELVGDGSGEVVVRASTGNALIFRANMGRVSGFSFGAEADNYYSVHVLQGRLELEDCRIIAGPNRPAMTVRGGADPRVRRCEFIGNSATSSTLYCLDGALGTYEDCEFSGAKQAAYVYERADITLRRNIIRNHEKSSVVIRDGRATLEDNDISDNVQAGVYVMAGHALLRGNRINRNGFEAVWVAAGASATIENNDLRSNYRGAFDIEDGATVRSANNLDDEVDDEE